MIQMKDSGIEWIGESHKGWVKKPIKRLLESRKSGAWGKEPNIDEGTDKICIRVADFDFEKQIVNRDNLTIRNYDENTIKKLELKKGDILIEKSGGGEVTPVGRSVIFSLDSSCLYANFIDCLRCDKENEPKYIVLLLKALYHYGLIPSFIKQTTGIQNLDFPNLSQSNIFVPKKTVQQQIADYLDKKCSEIDACLSDVNESIAKLQEYKKSIITEAVTKGLDTNAEMKDSGIEWIGEIPKGWEKKKLKYVALLSQDKLPEKTDLDYEFNYIDIGSVNSIGEINTKEKISFENAPSRARMILEDGDIILSTVRIYLRAISFIYNSKDTIASTGFAVIRPFISTNNRYLYYFAISEYFIEKVVAFSKGVSYPAIDVYDLSSIYSVLPSTDLEQQQIANYLDKKCAEIDNVIKDKKELANKLKEYKHSLIYECVTGKREVG